MTNIIKIFKNEFKTLLTDKGTLLIMVIGAIAYAIFYSVPYITHILREVPISVVDNDRSSFSREFIRQLDANQFVEVSKITTLQGAKELYKQNKIKAYVVIPSDFEQEVKRGQKTDVAMFADSSLLLVYKQVATGVKQTAISLGSKIEIGKLMKRGMPRQKAMRQKLPFEFISIPLYNPVGSYLNYIYPLVLILVLQQTMLVGVGLLGGTAQERLQGVKMRQKDGTVIDYKQETYCEFSRNPSEIVFGKALAYVSLYMIHSIFYFLVFPIVFSYKMTFNVGLLLLLLVPYLFSVAFLGQTLIQFFKNRETAFLMMVIMALPILYLPGFVWPTVSMDSWLVVLSKFIPVTAATDGLMRVNQMGADFFQIQNDFYILIGLCFLYFVLAVGVARKLIR